jgi:hypothetical protein
MIRTTVLAMTLAACSGDTSAPVQKPTTQRQVTPRAKLPAAIQPLLPKHGIYAAGGGLTSAPWRVVVDTDAMTIFAGSSVQQNAPSFGKLDKEATNPLTAPNRDHLMKLAADAWSEPEPATRAEPIADYDEILVVADGDDTFYLEGYGPIRRTAAAKLLTDLRAAGGL